MQTASLFFCAVPRVAVRNGTEFNTTWMQRSFSYNAYFCVSLAEVVARKSNWKKELKNKNRATLLATQTLPVLWGQTPNHLDLLQVFRSIFNFIKMNFGLSKRNLLERQLPRWSSRKVSVLTIDKLEAQIKLRQVH